MKLITSSIERTIKRRFSSHDTHEEDKLTTLYLMKLARVDATYVPLSQLRIVPASTVEEGEHIEAGVYDQHGQK